MEGSASEEQVSYFPADSDSAPGHSPRLLLPDLLQDLGTLVALLVERIEREDDLDAYLLSVGVDQILEDSLGGRPSIGGRAWGRRVGEVLSRSRRSQPVGRVLLAALDLADAAAARTAPVIKARAAHVLASDLAADLAGVVLRPSAALPTDRQRFGDRAGELAKATAGLSGRRRTSTLRLPSCFRSFDQQPLDLVLMAQRYAQRWPSKDASILVAGVRTSGSYLAPLLAAALRFEGYRSVSSISLRPRASTDAGSRALLERCAAQDGMVLIVDDPPTSGGSVAAVARRVERAGISPDHIVVMLGTDDAADGVHAPLRGYQSVLLPAGEWAVQRQLEASAVAQQLDLMLGSGARVVEVKAHPAPEPTARAHVRRRYTVLLEDGGGERACEVVVEGVGLGFFGRHHLAVSSRLDGWVPPVLGVEHGLAYRLWIDEIVPQDAPNAEDDRARMVAYAASRRAALAVGSDRSAGIVGNHAVWEVASELVAACFGPLGDAVRPLYVDPLMRRLLRPAAPSVVDGRMEADKWVRSGDRLVKTDPTSGAFSHHDLSCYDAVFDLAAVALEAGRGADHPRSVAGVKAHFEELTASTVDDGRWLLYQLVHLWNGKRLGRLVPAETSLAGARALQRFFAEVYLADLPAVDDGPLCALDLDGVSESTTFGWSAPTRASMVSVRALRAHGYRVVLATGRSLPEVIDRCAAYGLAGGVAEYGAAAYSHADRKADILVPESEAEGLADLRGQLDRRSDLEVDPHFRHVVRVRQVAGGKGGPMPDTEISPAAGPGPPPWRTVVGLHQTDIVPRSVDKGAGLENLASRLAPGAPEIALAVGDSSSDLPMLAKARRAFAPANASAELRRPGVDVLRAPYQAGLAQAVSAFLGHRPGTCRACRPRPMSADIRLLVDLLSLREGGNLGVARRALPLTAASFVRLASR